MKFFKVDSGTKTLQQACPNFRTRSSKAHRICFFLFDSVFTSLPPNPPFFFLLFSPPSSHHRNHRGSFPKEEARRRLPHPESRLPRFTHVPLPPNLLPHCTPYNPDSPFIPSSLYPRPSTLLSSFPPLKPSIHPSHTSSILQNSFCSINLSKFISAFGVVFIIHSNCADKTSGTRAELENRR